MKRTRNLRRQAGRKNRHKNNPKAERLRRLHQEQNRRRAGCPSCPKGTQGRMGDQS